MASSNFTFKRRNVLACGVAFAMAASMAVPVTAFADTAESSAQPVVTDAQPDSESPDVIAIDKGEAYQEAPVSSSPIALFSYSYTRITPMDISDNMKYFTLYESGRNYDQGFSYGDGYHAMGYYQFDNRYSLQDFMQGCYWYDPDTFSMFKWATDSSVDLSKSAMAVNGQLTDLGKLAQDSWHAAYATAPTVFSQLQDGYAYTNYYLPAQNYLSKMGIDISNRNDAVKGLAWGMCVLFGSGGMRTYFDSANLTNDMTDAQFVTNVCDSVINNVSSHVSNYASSYQNRYAREKATCLDIIEKTGDTRVAKPSNDVANSGAAIDGDQAANGDATSNGGATSNGDSSSASNGENNAVEPEKPALPVQPGESGSSSSASNSASSTPATGNSGSTDGSAGNQPSAPSDSAATPGAPSTDESSASGGNAAGETNGNAASGGTTENGSNGVQQPAGDSSNGSNASGSEGGSSASGDQEDVSKPGKDDATVKDPASSAEPKEPAVVTTTNPNGGDITTLSLNKTVEKETGAKESGDTPQAKVEGNGNSAQQASDNAPQQAKKLSETNDGMMGLFIAMAAAAVAALAAIGVAVLRMTHRDR